MFPWDDEAGSWVGASRDRASARRERGERLGFRAGARGGIGCSRSYARSGPVPRPLVCFIAHGDRAREVGGWEFSGFSGGMIWRGRG